MPTFKIQRLTFAVLHWNRWQTSRWNFDSGILIHPDRTQPQNSKKRYRNPTVTQKLAYRRIGFPVVNRSFVSVVHLLEVLNGFVFLLDDFLEKNRFFFENLDSLKTWYFPCFFLAISWSSSWKISKPSWAIESWSFLLIKVRLWRS